jgi:transcriptional regulator with XRE-family HTH domain
MSILDGPLVTNIRYELGLTRTQVANLCGIRAATVHRIEHGKDPDLTLHQLHRLADVLRLDIIDLFRDAKPAARTTVPDGPQADAATLGAVLWALHGSAQVRLLQDSLRWKLERINKAQATLGGTLAATGLTLRRLHGTLTIQPAAEHAHATSNAESATLAIKGLDLLDYRLAYRLLRAGHSMGIPRQFRQRMSVQRLRRHNVIEGEPSYRLTKPTLFSLCIHDHERLT